jgi:hypothetical protein
MISTVLIFVLVFGSFEPECAKAQSLNNIYYFTDFSGFPTRRPPWGWMLRNTGQVLPAIEEFGGSGPEYRLVSFPEVGWEYWDCWMLKLGIVASGNYITKVKLNFRNSVADRAGLTIAWDDASWDRVDIQPNVYWDDIEFRVRYTGPIEYELVIETLATINVLSDTDYWLKVFVQDFGPGMGVADVFWSMDNTTFTHVLHVTGIPNLTNW